MSASPPGRAPCGEWLLQQELHTQARAQRFYTQQRLDHLNPAMLTFIDRMELMFVATADATGACDVSLRAGPPGFLSVLTPTLLGYPEYRGNGVMASMGNIIENPHLGLLLVDFVDDVIGLHVNGTARLVADAEMRPHHPGLPAETVPGRTPIRWVLLEVEEAYVHCRKHIPRMRPAPGAREWGTDNAHRKGGDYFGTSPKRA